MTSTNQITSTLNRHKKQLFADYPLRSMAIFGSYARMEQNEKSDLDILVEFNDNIGIRFIDLADEIEAIIGFKVDLVSRKGIKDEYYNTISSDLIYV